MGLQAKHHSELNGIDVPSHRYDELRQEYVHDAQALQQIDVYDPSTLYHVWLAKYKLALVCNDAQDIAECEAWFYEHYKLI